MSDFFNQKLSKNTKKCIFWVQKSKIFSGEGPRTPPPPIVRLRLLFRRLAKIPAENPGTKPYLYFLVSLLVSPNTHLGWLCLCRVMDQNLWCEPNADGVSHVENGHKNEWRLWAWTVDTFKNTITGQGKKKVNENAPLPIFMARKNPKKKPEVAGARPRRTMPHYTKLSVHEHGYVWIHWNSPPMDRRRI